MKVNSGIKMFTGKNKIEKIDSNVIIKLVILTVAIICVFFAAKFYRHYSLSSPGNNPPRTEKILSVFYDDKVRIFSQERAKCIETKKNFELYKGDVLATRKANRVLLDYRGKCSLRLASGSIIKFIDGTGNNLILELKSGRLWVQSWDGKYNVKTPSGEIKLGQGAVQVRVYEDKTSSVHCYTGPVDVVTSLKNNRGSLKSGEIVYIDEKNKIQSGFRVSNNTCDSWERWNLAFIGRNLGSPKSIPPLLYDENEVRKIEVSNSCPPLDSQFEEVTLEQEGEEKGIVDETSQPDKIEPGDLNNDSNQVASVPEGEVFPSHKRNQDFSPSKSFPDTRKAFLGKYEKTKRPVKGAKILTNADVAAISKDNNYPKAYPRKNARLDFKSDKRNFSDNFYEFDNYSSNMSNRGSIRKQVAGKGGSENDDQKTGSRQTGCRSSNTNSQRDGDALNILSNREVPLSQRQSATDILSLERINRQIEEDHRKGFQAPIYDPIRYGIRSR